MTTALAVLDQLTEKTKRAKTHIAGLQALCDEFFEQKPYELAFLESPTTGDRTYYVKKLPEIPLKIASAVGYILQNLRSSLDHLAHHLVCVGTGSSGPFRHVYFPIFETAAGFVAVAPAKTKGMKRESFDLIASLEPYGGGRGAILWHLHDLNNMDKHRLLIRLGTIFLSHSVLPSQRAALTEGYLGSYPGSVAPDLRRSLIAPATGRMMLRGNDSLLTVTQSEIEAFMTFQFDVAFDDSLSTRGHTVVETLNDMANFVLDVTLRFSRVGLL